MKVKVLQKFRDKHTGEIYPVGKTLTITKERCEEILKVTPLVEEIKTNKKKSAE
jgi:hypothetical protein